ncbi:L-galactonate transporter [Aquisphaera giovannonii]|uniref:L-galactonate transporter n=1 Tax=Aquisphaera giovannonii TaxID=406548 RepID=A0A5B9W2F9_9BACT|nr:MFS transporter [Aquisphaera giovannonii]QEH34459.1 L-galactonate transporter [Aquisphaera giovannonii]
MADSTRPAAAGDEIATGPLEPGPEKATPLRAWGICGLMFFATVLNYMDRQTLAQQASEIREALSLSNGDYGLLELGFGIAFALGSVAIGLLVDRVSLRWLFPAVLLGWSAVGFLTGRVTSYAGLFLCRIALGAFEAGQWPCALAASQRLLTPRQRAMGNSILQSGASLGAIVTPQVILLLNSGGPGGWRLPFQVVGASGLLWIVAWFLMIRPGELELPASPGSGASGPPDRGPDPGEAPPGVFAARLSALLVVVVVINLCWQYFRAWMPMMLEKHYGYGRVEVQHFSSWYYLVAGVGCIASGYVVKSLAARGFAVHDARMAAFACGVALTSLSVSAAFLPASTLLLGCFLAVGFGSLGQFPPYYAFTQDLSVRRMGKVTGILSFATWIATAIAQWATGRWIDRTGSYDAATICLGLAPIAGLLALVLLWNRGDDRGARASKLP